MENLTQEFSEKEKQILDIKNEIYEDLKSEKDVEAVTLFMEKWDEIKSFINDYLFEEDEDGKKIKPEIEDLDSRTEYKYDFFKWLHDMEIEYHNTNVPQARISLCLDILDMFAWKKVSPENYHTAIAESLNDLKRYEECNDLLEKCIRKKPDNINYINMYILCLSEQKEWDKAISLIEKHIPLTMEVNYENLLLFYRATEVFEAIDDKETLQKYRNKIFDFKGDAEEEMMKLTEIVNGLNLESQEPKKEEKPAKVGRNDLCPCGSGKKYKKCCGQNI